MIRDSQLGSLGSWGWEVSGGPRGSAVLLGHLNASFTPELGNPNCGSGREKEGTTRKGESGWSGTLSLPPPGSGGGPLPADSAWFWAGASGSSMRSVGAAAPPRLRLLPRLPRSPQLCPARCHFQFLLGAIQVRVTASPRLAGSLQAALSPSRPASRGTGFRTGY